MTYFAVLSPTPGVTIPRKKRIYGQYKKICIICGNFFKISTARKGTRLKGGKRKRNCKTCSKKCSRIYTYRHNYNHRQDLYIQRITEKKMINNNNIKGGKT